MAHYDDLYPGRFLKATALARPTTIRIVSLGGEMLEGDDGEKAKGVLRYRTAGPDGKAIDGEMVLAKTNAILIAAILGTADYKTWAGHLVTITNDPSVMFGGERVGGIRVFGSPELNGVLVVEVKRPRRKKKERYTLRPTDGQGRVRGPAHAAAPPAPPPDDEPRPNSPDDLGYGADGDLP